MAGPQGPADVGFARDGIGISGPFIIEAGATGIDGYAMGMDRESYLRRDAGDERL